MYKALYSKWRPLTFNDVISQPHITTTLKNQIINARTAHAYLFTGSRGTGKTTCARIFAKAVNCPNAKDGNPCLECDVCKDADNSALADIIEIDAASNTSVNDMRELRDGTIYTPERCAYKIYIIDEVHMLSVSAFNALLKIMEEPPPYIKFILATTEIHKVPATITSRCQRYDFHRIIPEDICKRLEFIALQENINLSHEAGELIARIADGGMRDAISLLDQCSAFSNEITAETVASASGIADRFYLIDILETIISKDTAKAIEIINQLYSMSKDMQRLCDELISQFRNIMLIKINSQNIDILSCMPSEISRLKEIAEKIPLQDILDKISILQSCNEKLNRSINKRVELEMCIIKLSTVQISQKGLDNSDIYDKMKQLEQQFTMQIHNVSEQLINAPIRTVSPPNTVSEVKTAEIAKHTLTPQRSEQRNTFPVKLLPEWSEIVNSLKELYSNIYAFLVNVRAYTDGQNIFIDVGSENPLFQSIFKDQANKDVISNAVRKITGKEYYIMLKPQAESLEIENSAVQLFRKAENSHIDCSADN